MSGNILKVKMRSYYKFSIQLGDIFDFLGFLVGVAAGLILYFILFICKLIY